MGSSLWWDIVELFRSIGLAGRLPTLRRRITAGVAEVDQVVAPIMTRFGSNGRLDDDIYDVCSKVCFLLDAYATTAGVRFRGDLAALGGAVGRVYDDLIDSLPHRDDMFDARVTALFEGGSPTPHSDRERLLYALYRELEHRLDRSRTDPVYAALRALHRSQVRSRQQHDPDISQELVSEITAEKGGHAMVVFVGLVHPALTEQQISVVHQLGVVLQLLDDYVDIAADQRAGITTSATRHELTLADICRQLRILRPALRACYGREQPLNAVLYAYLWLVFLRRRSPSWPARRRPFRVMVRAARRRNRTVNTRRREV